MISFLWIAGIVVFAGGLASVGGLLLARRCIDFEKLRPSHDVGVIYFQWSVHFMRCF